MKKRKKKKGIEENFKTNRFFKLVVNELFMRKKTIFEKNYFWILIFFLI